MKIAITLLAMAIGLLSIAAGVAKVTLVPEEIEFLQQFGFNDLFSICFGILQVLGGLLLLVPVTRLYGSCSTGIYYHLS